ncbi:phage holin family protein [Bacillus sp. 103mf]|uniref:phage holin family protein n=1 Tax=Bacillus sp. 103mf TaxID=1761751 RepID=UPI0008F0C895|nr:phage holin family protein [Bacillus sp. 103mf]SFS91837.1 toxin secretion/phage lysis holin [Bacillus sp. 103mf]
MERLNSLVRTLNITDVIGDPQFKTAAAISGGLGTFVSFLYGGQVNQLWITALVLIVVLDWITGIKAAKKDGTYASEYGIEGIARAVVLFLLPSFAHVLDMLVKLPDIFFCAITGGLIYHIFNSFTANCARIGWEKWIPSRLLRSVSSEIEAKIRRSESRKNRN